mgnify:CR=1 FL=1
MKKNTKKPEIFNIIPPDLSQKEQALELAKKDIITFEIVGTLVCATFYPIAALSCMICLIVARIAFSLGYAFCG